MDLFISSATPQKELERIVEAKGISKFFISINGSPQSKDMHIRNILELTNLNKDELVFVGDADQDREAAKSVGVHFIGVGIDNFPKETISVKNLNSLHEVFLKRS